MKSSSPYIAQMLENIAKIRRFVGTMSIEEFRRDELVQSAVLMQLEQIGEMAKRVPEEARADTHIPWAQIAGMRNRIVHEYYNIDIENVWKIISEELARTEAPLAEYLKQHPLPQEI